MHEAIWMNAEFFPLSPYKVRDIGFCVDMMCVAHKGVAAFDIPLMSDVINIPVEEMIPNLKNLEAAGLIELIIEGNTASVLILHWHISCTHVDPYQEV
jgi:hypothetical protein